MDQKNKSHSLWKGLIIIACIGSILYYFRGHTDEIQQIKKISIKDILLLTGTLFTVQALHCYKLYLLIDPFGLKGINFIKWFKIITVSRFVNQHVFQGANLYRFVKLKKDYQFSYTNSFGLTLYYLWLETVNLLFITILIIGATLVFAQFDFIQILMYLILIFFGVLISPFVFMFLYTKTGLHEKFKLNEQVEQVKQTVFSHVKQPRFLLLYLGTTFLFIVVYMITVGIGFRAVDVQLTFYQNLLFTIVLILSRMFNIVPANIGISEVVCGTISKAINVSFGSGIIISGTVRIINYVIYGLVTLFVYISSLVSPAKDEKIDSSNELEN